MDNKEIITKEYTKPLICDRCGGTEFIKHGTQQISGNVRQRYQCKNKKCGKQVLGELIEEPQETAANFKK